GKSPSIQRTLKAHIILIGTERKYRLARRRQTLRSRSYDNGWGIRIHGPVMHGPGGIHRAIRVGSAHFKAMRSVGQIRKFLWARTAVYGAAI
ncbi:hypothetical protein OAL49_09490, partial [Gammaproteobacteria bacterium]|nr:hypothetical protein [Gammaproteobacteria bacterium]